MTNSSESFSPVTLPPRLAAVLLHPDLILFGVVRVASLKDLGCTPD